MLNESRGTPSSKIGLIKYFRNLFYNALPHEIRAKVSSIEIYLHGLKTRDVNLINKELYETSEWSSYKHLKEFDPDIYLRDLSDRFDPDFLINTFNLFNSKMGIKSIILDMSGLLKYFRNSKKYFNKVSSGYKLKIDRIVKDLLNGDFRNYVIETVEILRYDEYLSDKEYLRNVNLEKLLEIDYRKFYK